MKIDNEKNKFQKNVMFTNRLQNCPTKRKSNTKGGKDNNTNALEGDSLKSNKNDGIYEERNNEQSSKFC